MKITRQQIRRIVKRSLGAPATRHAPINEGFFDFMAEKLGGLLGLSISRAKSMEDAEEQLTQAIGTYAMSVLKAQGGVKNKDDMGPKLDSALKQTLAQAQKSANKIRTGASES